MNNDINNLKPLILHYLVCHPKGSDTIDGIIQWWLLRERIDRTAEAISVALEELTVAGKIQKKINRDGAIVYSLNGERTGYAKE